MASPIGVPHEDQLLCPICLSDFTEPVSTPCGHNFCRACIKAVWANQIAPSCPCCRGLCRPTEIRVNTGLRDIVTLLKSKRPQEEEGSAAAPGEVPCDVCPVPKDKALKTCLVCLVSYCRLHLESHYRVPGLKKHQLEEPLVNLADRVCVKHNKVFEVFCRKDQVILCVLCLRDGHLTHETVSLEEEAGKRSSALGVTMVQIKQQEEHKAVEIKDVKRCMTKRRIHTERDTQESTALLRGLVASVEAYMEQMLGVIKEGQKLEETKATDLLSKLQFELSELSQKSQELTRLSQITDPFLLLNCSSSSWLAPDPLASGASAQQQQLCAAEVKAMVARVEDTLSRDMQKILGVWTDELKVEQQGWVEVDLDADTAHPSLVLSQDKKRVKDGGGVSQELPPINPKRFDFHHWVLAVTGYSRGHFYFQVEVGGLKGWEIGVARGTIQRKGPGVNLSPQNGIWTLGLYQGQYQANTNPPIPLHLGHQPQRVGVSVDYDQGTISLYNVDTRILIYRFGGCTFNASSFRYFPRTNIYPFFRPSEYPDDDMLTISLVQKEPKSLILARTPPPGQPGARGRKEDGIVDPPSPLATPPAGARGRVEEGSPDTPPPLSPPPGGPRDREEERAEDPPPPLASPPVRTRGREEDGTIDLPPPPRTTRHLRRHGRNLYRRMQGEITLASNLGRPGTKPETETGTKTGNEQGNEPGNKPETKLGAEPRSLALHAGTIW